MVREILRQKKTEEDLEGFTEAQYDRWANGSRNKQDVKVDPEQVNAILRAFPMKGK